MEIKARYKQMQRDEENRRKEEERQMQAMIREQE
jgi:hypothetical protein